MALVLISSSAVVIFKTMSSTFVFYTALELTSEARILRFFSYFLPALIPKFLRYWTRRLMHTSAFEISTFNCHWGRSSIYLQTKVAQSVKSRFLTIFSKLHSVATDISFATFLSFASGSNRKNEFSHTARYLS